LQLCISKELPHNVKYLTLSHCWGAKVFETLTKKNMAQFLSKIPVEVLTKTFRDAIIATRRLGFEYIWIDSLCIIQDDDSDWQHESTLMGGIYANSALTIAAMDAPDGDAGCFSYRNSRFIKNWTMLLTDNGTSISSAWNCAKPNFRHDLLERSRLQNRAWVFQERLLSPRTLFLGVEQVVWECRSSFACESFPAGYDDGAMTIPGICANWTKFEGRPTDFWSSVISNYNGRQLTYSQDKLVAISGASRLFLKEFGSEYLAGMWKGDLARQLLWYAVDDQSKKPRPEKFQAPTWSWASIN
ncbi:heterokaryon incompatibility protein-domain-containing protein, partial [Leptodontidium sp. 2 PMI_412]